MKSVMVKIADLQTNMYVRKTLSEDHFLYLAELLTNGVALPPIKISKQMGVVDGRHRIEAYLLADRTEIEAIILDIDNEADLVAEAYKANVGGSLPPSQGDTEHTIMKLLDLGESKKRVAELLNLPSGMARRYITDVQSKAATGKAQASC